MLKLTVCQLWSKSSVPYSPNVDEVLFTVIDKESEADDALPAASVAVAVIP